MTTELSDADPRLQQELSRIHEIVARPSSRNLRKEGRPRLTGIRPRNAATLLLVDMQGGKPLVLMGRRNRNLAFMPGALVFPGGRVDPSDGSIPAATELADTVARRLVTHMGRNATPRGARALGMAALRELAEETGLLLGERDAAFTSLHSDWHFFRDRQVSPSLGGLRLLSRAITPPGPPRRFDTWFFVTTTDHVAYAPPQGFEASGELEELRWISPEEAMQGDTREITRVMLVELLMRIDRDPTLSEDFPAPSYRALHGRFQKSIMT